MANRARTADHASEENLLREGREAIARLDAEIAAAESAAEGYHKMGPARDEISELASQ